MAYRPYEPARDMSRFVGLRDSEVESALRREHDELEAKYCAQAQIEQARQDKETREARLRAAFDWNRATNLRYIDWFFKTYALDAETS